MSVQVKKLVCPSCNAQLKINSSRKTAFCEYCGSKLSIFDDEESPKPSNSKGRGKKASKTRTTETKWQKIISEAMDNVFIILILIIMSATLLGIVLVPSILENRQRERNANSDIQYVTMPGSKDTFMGENYEIVKKELEEAGFTNIVCVKEKELSFSAKGDVLNMSINGSYAFRAGKEYPSDSKIVLTYKQ